MRHWRVLIKLALVVVATMVLLQLAPIGSLSDAATAGTVTGAQWAQARLSPAIHAAGGLLVLLAATVLATVKPRGLTRYGYRRTTGAAPHRCPPASSTPSTTAGRCSQRHRTRNGLMPCHQ